MPFVPDGKGGWRKVGNEEPTWVKLKSSGEASGYHTVTAAMRERVGQKARVVDKGATKYIDGHASRNATVDVDGAVFEWPYGWWELCNEGCYEESAENAEAPVQRHGLKQGARLAKEKKAREEEEEKLRNEMMENKTAQSTTEPEEGAADDDHDGVADCQEEHAAASEEEEAAQEDQPVVEVAAGQALSPSQAAAQARAQYCDCLLYTSPSPRDS
eukprot:TRINITY_DN1423_c0_g1_i3.p1 TRINITY_DN1423_c0_g1~~TRINITY_DN1423_c0_g1_i3.p1  ORF type:complete len:215 (+),score=73.40 TRINITY_DN1423_c0_g1_i3:255-899(+)